MPTLPEKLKKYGFIVYPIIIIIGIPILLILNTLWNLKSFNRDVNYVVRHQAINIAHSIKPFIAQEIDNEQGLDSILLNIAQSNSDIVSSAILMMENGEFAVVSSTSSYGDTEILKTGLNQLAAGFDQSFAGLTYDANLQNEVWNVVVPLNLDTDNKYFLNIKLNTNSVDAILSRTSRDSILVLAVLTVVVFILLANHFIFYKKAIKARQLAELDRLKDEFISMAAHELKAPMTGLAGYLEILRSKITPSQLPAIKENLDILDVLIVDLGNLINDLLDVSRLDQGRLKITPSQVQINDIIQKVIDTLKPTADQKNLKLVFNPSELPKTNTDPDRVRQIITNIISNSIKYTLKGEISVNAKAKEKFIEIEIKDTGIGIPPEELQKLFTKFHRVKDKQTYEVRGTGLGLWITKQIVEILGGKIHVQSIYGTGTSISFTIPIRTT